MSPERNDRIGKHDCIAIKYFFLNTFTQISSKLLRRKDLIRHAQKCLFEIRKNYRVIINRTYNVTVHELYRICKYVSRIIDLVLTF